MATTAWARNSPTVTAKLAVLLVGCAFWLSSLAANNSLVESDELSQDPPGFHIASPALSARKTDLFLVPPTDTADHTTDLADVDLYSIAPVLSLAPRVSSILDQVFAIDATTDREPDQTASEPENSESALPVADYVNSRRDSETGKEEDLKLPQIQQQMYRKDI
jgi:hypothetical protein